ncbi:DUF4376 domain-containing protein [Billgrantia gudaonensis]|uniref:DUF4376 domain-containing protein n=1 Tax=Billgrantia gudaonensis TaxID=376427 RepID=A0A1G9DVA2_9GAMM|nr:DUF4376 domain-containing protein [Halomonas gudaonensis]SDK67786.1 protein of unknown function [Halomonas gudaonensis]
MYYSKTLGGFASKAMHDDAVRLSKQRYSELLEGQAKGQRIVPDGQGRPTLADPPAPGIDTLAARKRREIATALADALAAGMPYTMPDGTEDVVQMRAEDRQNLMGLAIEARDLKAAGVTDAVQEFRAASNTRYPMTPDQVIAMTDDAMAHYKQLLQRSWDRKDAIDEILADEAMSEDEKREGVEGITW